jgi:branched-chain amino acid transport system ATP-binding protein
VSPAATAEAVVPLLAASDLVVTFGGVRAVDGVTFAVAPGELHGLIGPNGAGKTTTLDALTGFVDHAGRIDFDGQDVTDLAPHARARAGLARTFQSLELFDDLTVHENCQIATLPTGVRPLLRDLLRRPGPTSSDVEWALDLFDLGEVAERRPDELSLGHRKLVAVARALAARPRLLLLDEPAAGLDSDESAVLGAHLRAVVNEGVTVVLVDHDMGLVLGVCDRVTVLDFGRVLATGSAEQIRSDTAVIDAYLGARHGSGGVVAEP